MNNRDDPAHRKNPVRQNLDDETRAPGAGDQGHPPDFKPGGQPEPGAGDQGHAPDFSQADMPEVGAGDQGHPPAFHHQDPVGDEDA